MAATATVGEVEKKSGEEHDAKDDGTIAEEDTPYPFSSIVLPLLLVSVSNQWVRSALYYLVDFNAGNAPLSETATANLAKDLSRTAMNVDLNFNVEQYGLLASAAFTILFALASPVAGSLTDRYDRRTLAVGSCVAWSLTTLGMACATSYESVAALRALTGLSCAFAAPAAYTLLRDRVPARRSGVASATYGSGIYVGEAMASLSILTDRELGWRGSLGVAGLGGLMAAAMAGWALPPDPPRRDADTDDARVDEEDDEHPSRLRPQLVSSAPNLLVDARDVLTTSDRTRYLFLAVFFRFCSGLLIGVWSAPYFRLAFPDDASSYAVVNAIIVGVCGVTSGMVGGAASDVAGVEVPRSRWGREGGWDDCAGQLAVPILGSVLAAPVWFMVLNANTFNEAMAWLAVKYLVAECWFGPAVAVLQKTVPPRLGGTAQGLFALTGAVANLAPSGMGVLFCWAADAATAARDDGWSGTVAGGARDGTEQLLLGVGDGRAEILANLLGAAVCATYLLSATCFVLCARASRTQVKET